jgi:hypothetical protein
MDANAATILAGILGAIIGAPAGFFIERLVNRARVKISYAETAYEDIYALPEDVQQNLVRMTDFVGFVDAQVKWSLRQRLLANLFTREELRLLHEFGQHFVDFQRKWSAKAQNEILPMLARGGNEVEPLIPELEGEYTAFYPSNNLSQDLRADASGTVSRLVHQYNVTLGRAKLMSGWLDQFLGHVEVLLKRGHGTSEHVIVRISIGNSGYQDAIIKTEARLLAVDEKFRLPMQTTNRPWETSETRGRSQFHVISPRSFLVLEFLLDENLNAKADLDKLRNELGRGAKATLAILGIDGATVAEQSFTATLQ